MAQIFSNISQKKSAEDKMLTKEIVEREPNSGGVKFNTDALEGKAFLTASNFTGDVSMFKLSLLKLVEEYKKESKTEKKAQEERKSKMKDKLQELKSEKTKTESEIKQIKESQIAEFEKENLSLLKKINDIRNNFHKVYEANVLIFKKPLFVIEIFALFFLTLFLFDFYMNITYSAFVKNIGIEMSQSSGGSNASLLFNSILDPNTLDVASNNLSVFIFIFLAPFIVFSVGILVHNLFEKRQFVFLIVALVLVFIFDSLMAYEIVKKIYTAEYLAGLSNTPWKPTQVFEMGEFYLVLFAGFVTYILWGFILHFTIKNWEASKPARFAVKNIKLKIERNEKNIVELKEELNFREKKIIGLEKEISLLENRIQNFFYYDINKLKLLIYSFAQGWAKFVSGTNDGTEEKLEKLKTITEDLLSNLERGNK